MVFVKHFFIKFFALVVSFETFAKMHNYSTMHLYFFYFTKQIIYDILCKVVQFGF